MCRSTFVLLALVVLATASCLPNHEFRCETNASCGQGASGVCEPTGYCSFPDSSCESGYRYAPESDVFSSACTDLHGADAGTNGADDTPQPDSELCGNGVIDGDEECDGANLVARTCEMFGYVGGRLMCSSTCQLDESECLTYICGNGALEPEEACDGALLDGQTCQSQTGLPEGDLYCEDSCLSFDTSYCHECGNGLCEPPSESRVTCPQDCEWRLITGGDDHSCGVRTTNVAYCWGRNEDGQLGTGDTTDYRTPEPVSGLTGVQGMTAGLGRHSCAVKLDGTVWCWGNNDTGALGTGNNTSSLVPVQVHGLAAASAVEAGKSHSCALLQDGTIWCWGRNNKGQLGDGTLADSSVPRPVTGLPVVVELSSGKEHNCARTSGGDVYCWGNNDKRQSAPGSQADALSPVMVTGLSAVAQVSAGGKTSCALLGDQTSWCWGENGKGELGRGFASPWESPGPVSALANVSRLQAGEKVTCALLADQTVWCWGENNRGQLGNNRPGQSSSVPVPVASLGPVAQLVGGKKHLFALQADGSLWGWGENDRGQLGDGTQRNQPLPIMVRD